MDDSPNLIGSSSHFLEVLDKVSLYAPLERPVLVIGERGTGKELIAARLHFLSRRWDSNYLSLNCASLNPNLIESELFGHQAGAFTGASQKHSGRFEQADGGTLFLDELANLPASAQEKLLRVLEYGSFERVGSNHTIHVDVRVIGATNEDLPALVEQGRFRADLLDRLAFSVITLPPLRERLDDIPQLALQFAANIAHEIGLSEIALAPNAIDKLASYQWPGNVRELKNVIERAVVHQPDSTLDADSIQFDPFDSPWRPGELKATAPGSSAKQKQTALGSTAERALQPGFDLRQHMLNEERRWLELALTTHRYQQTKAAHSLGLSYHQLRGLLKKHHLPTKA
ncbi:phage shock protein operon transcriptional activator [Aliagarivorans taiwanensis]|uniref:phage shock protein operon transcriptional activator n=1 Tax=Aliagarivorans taiwanensis TaxID=561966 RepID=UPI00047A32D3|nr:phage shock protein operon transcriptional activator [Aliagarivorans taiwanensis]